MHLYCWSDMAKSKEELMEVREEDMRHERFIFPVGQGGFAGERIGNYVVAFDCGSISSTSMVESCIDHVNREIDHVDLLFISHFDNDHVNGIRYLLSYTTVKKAVVSWIPQELRAAYGVYTNGAYTATMGLLRGDNVDVEEIGEEERDEKSYDIRKIWEWIAKSMMTTAEFNKIMANMRAAGIDVPKLTSDPFYLENQKENVNAVFKDEFGAKGPNTKGLIMLSQKCAGAPKSATVIGIGCWRRCWPFDKREFFDETSCLYVGDADLKNKANNKLVKDFLNNHRWEQLLLMMQIPHHGSQYNIGSQFETDFLARYYYVNDIDTKRLQKNVNLFKSLTSQKNLMVSRGLCKDLIWTMTRF